VGPPYDPNKWYGQCGRWESIYRAAGSPTVFAECFTASESPTTGPSFYVCDRSNQRVQGFFTLEGELPGPQVLHQQGPYDPKHRHRPPVRQTRRESRTRVLKSAETAVRDQRSQPDPHPRFLYVLDGAISDLILNAQVARNRRPHSATVVGASPAQFSYIMSRPWPNPDSHNNFYTAEINENSRVQKSCSRNDVDAAK